MGSNPDVKVEGEEIFKPREFIQLLDDFFSEIFGDDKGFMIGMAYAGLTMFLYMALAYGIFFIMNSSKLSFADRVNISLLSLSIGSLLLAGGSSLANHFDSKDMNYSSYISNSIIFISSGICFLTASVFGAFLTSTSNIFLVFLFGAVKYWLNFIGAILISTGLWVFLKLLWRLHQLVSVPEAERDYVEREWVGADPIGGLIYPFMVSGIPILVIELATFSFELVLLLGLLVAWFIPLSWNLYNVLSSERPLYNLAHEIWKSRYTILFFFGIFLLGAYHSHLSQDYGLSLSNADSLGLWKEIVISESTELMASIEAVVDRV